MALSLASLFTDHMVLQRSKPVQVWGWASAGAKVSAEFAGQKAQGTADEAGKWQLTFGPLEASAQGRELVVRATESAGATETITLKNVLVGEVWLCSGQSNMQWTLDKVNNAQQEVTTADYPLMRLFTVANRVSDEPLDRLVTGEWKQCTPATAGVFSAVGYLFGREIHQKLGVPVGLIDSSWGGTRIEAWTSRETLVNDAPQDASVAQMMHDAERDGPSLEVKHAKWKQDVAAIQASHADVQNKGLASGWAGDDEPADGKWADMTLPCYWQAAGVAGSGILWFRKTVDLPASWAGREILLGVGAADKSDKTYFNGEQVGSLTMAMDPMAWNTQRSYKVNGKLVKAGRNVIAVRVHSDQQAGGLNGPAHQMHVTCPSLPGEKPIAIAGVWRYAIEESYGVVVMPEEPFGPESPHVPARLHNAMIRPLVPYAMRGVIWYQGESNATRAVQYRTLSPLLISDIRKHWADPSIGFHLVQLANYLGQSPEPGESNWAMLREAQTQTLSVPGTGMAVIIDVGEANDIHPKNKQDVALRLAHNALHTTYGMKDVAPCGPLLRNASVQGDKVVVMFDHAHEGLQIGRDGKGKSLTGFAIAGSDKKFVWADAKIQDDASVLVCSQKVAAPAYVRYAWADNPVCNLYNGCGLPASPFRTDVD